MSFLQRWKDQLPSDKVHIIYEEAYENLSDLSDLPRVFQNLGFQTKCWCITPEKARYLPSLIPPSDLVFFHLDPPKKVSLNYIMEPLRFLETAFPYTFGFYHSYCENTIFKSVMNSLFQKHNVPHCPNIRVERIDEENKIPLLNSMTRLGLPLFVKVDDGMDSEGLSEDCVAPTAEKALMTAEKLIKEFGPVNIQSYLSGREFTIALTPKGALHPVERLFKENELFSPQNGTSSECPLKLDEKELIQTCKDVAWKAYQAVEGSCYGRVDLRCDAQNQVRVLEVNTTCGFGPNSYFAISCHAANTSREEVIADIILSKLSLWNKSRINNNTENPELKTPNNSKLPSEVLRHIIILAFSTLLYHPFRVCIGRILLRDTLFKSFS